MMQCFIADLFTLLTFVFSCVCSEAVLPSIHANPEYPSELVGTWNTWYGEQDQAGKASQQCVKHTGVVKILHLIGDESYSLRLFYLEN